MKAYVIGGMGGTTEDWRWVRSYSPSIQVIPIPNLSFDDCAKSIFFSLLKKKEEFILGGYSMGGRIAIRIAHLMCQSNSSLLKSLLLWSTGLGLLDNEKDARSLADENWAKLAVSGHELFWKKWYEQELFGGLKNCSSEDRHHWHENKKIIDIKDLTHQIIKLSPCRHSYLLPELREVRKHQKRVLYMAGQEDRKYLALSDIYQEEGCLVSSVAQAGHLLLLEAPQAVASSINETVKVFN